jgi:hypothetical protein
LVLTQQQLFLAMVMSVLMLIAGVRECQNGHPAMGFTLGAIPFCYWFSVFTATTS